MEAYVSTPHHICLFSFIQTSLGSLLKLNGSCHHIFHYVNSHYLCSCWPRTEIYFFLDLFPSRHKYFSFTIQFAKLNYMYHLLCNIKMEAGDLEMWVLVQVSLTLKETNNFSGLPYSENHYCYDNYIFINKAKQLD